MRCRSPENRGEAQGELNLPAHSVPMPSGPLARALVKGATCGHNVWRRPREYKEGFMPALELP